MSTSNTSKFCTSCGQSIEENMQFCFQCGASVMSDPNNSNIGQVPKTVQGYRRNYPKSIFRSGVMTTMLLSLFLVFTLLVSGLLLVLSTEFFSYCRDEEFMILCVIACCISLALAIAAKITFLIFIYRCWSLIQDKYAYITPGKAVGFFFIPILRIFWPFIAVYGLAKNLNAYAERYGIAAPRTAEWLLLLGVTIFVLGMWKPMLFMPDYVWNLILDHYDYHYHTVRNTLPHAIRLIIGVLSMPLLFTGLFSMAGTAEAIYCSRESQF